MSDRLLTVRNRQRARRVNVRLLREVADSLLADDLGLNSYELSLQLVTPAESARLNEQFLGHDGPTDVITFDYRRGKDTGLAGDIVVCVAQAVQQAPRFRTTWQAELARYLVHGILHLLGFNDRTSAQRRRMKAREAKLLKALEKRYPLAKLGR